MEIKNIEERAAQAVQNFKEGYNCCQSVVMAYADLYGKTADEMAVIASAFGGGMAKMREVCGTCTGMFMIAGLQIPANDPKDKEAKAANYKLVQELAEEFRRENGSIICRELLGIDGKSGAASAEGCAGQEKKKRPCPELIRMAVEIVGRKLQTL